jgi:hypothetical protein
MGNRSGGRVFELAIGPQTGDHPAPSVAFNMHFSDRDIAADWRDLVAPCVSLPTRSPSQPRTKPGFPPLESSSGRETDSALEGDGFEPSVPGRI